MTVTITAQMGLEARDNLLWIVARWPRLKAALVPGGGSALNGMPRHAEEHPAPLNVHISDLMHEIETETRNLAHVLLDETNDWAPTTSAMPGLLHDVAQRYGHWTAGDLRTGLAFLDWAEDVKDRTRRALMPADPPKYIGPCQVRECEGELHLKAGKNVARCPHCGTETVAEDQRVWLAGQFEDRLMTPGEIVSALRVLIDQEVPIKTVRSWIDRGRLPEAVDGLYRIRDAQELALRRTRQRVA